MTFAAHKRAKKTLMNKKVTIVEHNT